MYLLVERRCLGISKPKKLYKLFHVPGSSELVMAERNAEVLSQGELTFQDRSSAAERSADKSTAPPEAPSSLTRSSSILVVGADR